MELFSAHSCYLYFRFFGHLHRIKGNIVNIGGKAMYYDPSYYPYQWIPMGSPPYTEPNWNQVTPHHMQDYGSNPFAFNIEQATLTNATFRTTVWTGEHLQVTLMCIGVGEDIGLEIHPDTDQFLRIEEGKGCVYIGRSPNQLSFRRMVTSGDAIMIPAGYWHNVINTENRPLKLYSIYAPPEHPAGTVHQTKEIAMHSGHH